MTMTDDRLKLYAGHAMGLICVSGLLIVIAKIAIGQVVETTSYGLMPLIVALSNLCVIYGNWAWQQPEKKSADEIQQGSEQK